MLELVFVIMHGCDNICVLLGHCNCIGEVMSVIEMVVDEMDDRGVHKVGMVVPQGRNPVRKNVFLSGIARKGGGETPAQILAHRR